MNKIKDLILQLEAKRQETDELMARLTAELREQGSSRDGIVELGRYRSLTRQAAGSFITEAIAPLSPDQAPSIHELLFVRVPAPAFHQ
ncbi:hypothetical protein PWG15_05290 [Ensifer adhaerens]|uniref:hypothetical protein n=1 Tax=Ensifer adhaerens TaxID=106592 RepID=UPI0023A9520F|nr:hypothetical protein [Ensifer adhaerens]WDZ77919.1 hypothetical protein PWG15_05290 [Ensifer adhaerens]